VKRLTCFAIKVIDEQIKEEYIMKRLTEFDNHLDSRDTID